jgi:hypothetical protein
MIDVVEKIAAPSADLTRSSARLFLLGGWLLFFGPQLASSAVPYYRDHLVTNIPLRHYTRERLLNRELPQWYPYESLGVPVIGQIALGTFHPFTFLFLPFQAVTAEKLSLLLSYLLGLFGAYRLARILPASRLASVTAAFSFAFGGYALGVSCIIAYAMSHCALPWVAWAAIRVARMQRLKDAALLGGLWSLVFLAGDAVSFSLAAVLLAIALVDAFSWRGVGLMALGGCVASLLVGIELIPATAVAAESVRALGQQSPTMGLSWAFHPMRIPELIIAGYVPDPIRRNVVTELFSGSTSMFATTLFAGGIALSLAVAGVGSRSRIGYAFLALSLLGFWMALGDRGGLLPLMKRAFWILTRFRYPERYLTFFWLGLCPLAALGTDRVRRSLVGWSVALIGVALCISTLSALCATQGASERVWNLVHRSLADPAMAKYLDIEWAAGLGWTSVLLLAAGLTLFLSVRYPMTFWLLPVFVAAELWRGNGPHLPLVDRGLIETPNEFVKAVRATSAPPEPLGRVLDEPEFAYSSTVTGPWRERFVSAMMHFMKADASGLHGITGINTNLGAAQVRHALLFGNDDSNVLHWGAFLNGCFRVVQWNRPLAPGEKVLASEESLGIKLIEAQCRPRAFTTASISAAGPAQALSLIESANRSGSPVVWEGPAMPEAVSQVTWLENQPERIRLRVQSDGPTALVLTDEYARGWTARVDGVRVPIHATLLAVRGVEVPGGDHEVAFEYHTPRLALGMTSSLSGLLLGLALAFLGHRKR